VATHSIFIDLDAEARTIHEFDLAFRSGNRLCGDVFAKRSVRQR
jgi:hypothetical protein